MWGPLLSFSLHLSSCIVLAHIVQAQGPPSGPDAWALHLVLLGRVRILGLGVRLGFCGADGCVTWHLGCAGGVLPGFGSVFCPLAPLVLWAPLSD